jgi:hypothetical protein
LHDQIAYLRDQLAQERAANRENRRTIAAYQGRMPELEAPSEPREDPETTTKDDGRERRARRDRRASSPPLVAKGVRPIVTAWGDQ